MISRPELIFVLNSLGVGGSESKIIKIANALSTSNVPVQIAYLNPPEALLNKVNPSVRVTHLHRRGKYSYAALRKLIDLVNAVECSLVAVNMYPLLYAIPAAKYLSSRKVPVIGLVNTTAEPKSQLSRERMYSPFLRQCDRVVFGCESQLKEWTARYRLPLTKTEFIYNGVDPGHYSPAKFLAAGVEGRNQLGIPERALVIGSVGRLAPEKNYDLLVAALARLNADGRDCYLVIAGDGKERKKLETLAARLGIDTKMRLLGLVEDVRPAIAMMDVFVLPSKEVETFSNAALEAMAMARTVVLSAQGGAAEMIELGKSGFLFPKGDLGALITILEHLYCSMETRLNCGVAARHRILQLFTFAKMVDRYRCLAGY